MKKGDIDVDTILIWILIIATVLTALVILFFKGQDILGGLKGFFDIFK